MLRIARESSTIIAFIVLAAFGGIPLFCFRRSVRELTNHSTQLRSHPRQLSGRVLRVTCTRRGMASGLRDAPDVATDLCGTTHAFAERTRDLARGRAVLLDGRCDRALHIADLADKGADFGDGFDRTLGV